MFWGVVTQRARLPGVTDRGERVLTHEMTLGLAIAVLLNRRTLQRWLPVEDRFQTRHGLVCPAEFIGSCSL